MVSIAKFSLRDMFLEGVRPLEKILKYIQIEGEEAVIDAKELKHKEVNDLLRYAALNGVKKVRVINTVGQRYIGTRLHLPSPAPKLEIHIEGTPGNDLGAFLDGHRIIVHGNAQDGVGNTMDDGEIIIHGRAGDVVAMSMRGGKIYIRDNVGYRTAIHMKEYINKVPVLVIGGTSQDFFGEYMAGGRVILLGLTLKEGEKHKAYYIGTGMHGGVIYLRGKVEKYQLGKEVGIVEMEKEDWKFVEEHVGKYCEYFNRDKEKIMEGNFLKLIPVSKRPYGKIYAY
ncbi:glutamate synthase (NADPH) GltB3 subunit [Archaeoglobus sulfaticallidus PM70-1]|uniref:Glutamate synthase (NADPH) GltB3 subunit n=1 Tax=Archaeoglobus sulfaticallidus PM70-1 TaxID=387631 RepID=N0BHZ4_9EURY|nr:glutamate synthase [Archaeoglobus sulfaticallidus]AGK60046.1 glutamate synthase (NADPH) GltB3 subunit [Archaeoglobus sulfaticallidus PM70-1]